MNESIDSIGSTSFQRTFLDTSFDDDDDDDNAKVKQQRPVENEKNHAWISISTALVFNRLFQR
jgi:hypothetical protein